MSTNHKQKVKNYSFSVQKRFGQNFLNDENVLDGIVNGAAISKEDTVLEIGPGMGALTKRLAKLAKKVYAIEVDRLLIPILENELHDFDNVELINADVLKVDLRFVLEHINGPLKVVANLPYYITTPVITKLFELHKAIDGLLDITVMVQKEVALRMNAKPNSKDYGSLSLLVQFYARPRILMHVSKNAFYPAPKVDSAVVNLKLYKEAEMPVKPNCEELMMKIIRASFENRRKTLANAINNAKITINGHFFGKEDVYTVLGEMGLDVNIRGEALSLESFALLSDMLLKL